MPFVVNGEIVLEERITQELQRIARDRHWQTIPDESERARKLRIAAEDAAIDKLLIEQTAANDKRPLEPGALEREFQLQLAQWGARADFDRVGFRSFVARQLRIQRTNHELTAAAEKPTPEQVEAFYFANKDQFRKPERFEAAHIVKYVNDLQCESTAREGIEAAFDGLKKGMPFAEAAAIHSDCKDKNGDLGCFPAGFMVDEFEDALRELEPGEYSSIFRSPFGFHIALLRTRLAPGAADLEEMRNEIERVMTFALQHEAYVQAVSRLRNRADIRRLPDS